MSICNHESMTNRYAPAALSGVSNTLSVWWQRYQQRRELAEWTERDLHDLGLSWSEMLAEADKPFWRA